MSDLKQQIKQTRIHLCLDCGKCTVVCPVARFDPGFNPRLLVQRNPGRLAETPDTSIWSCLGCHMCVERCNYRVKFPDFVRILRTDSAAHGGQPVCTHGGALQSLMHLMSGASIRQERLAWLPADVKLDSSSDTLFFTGCAPYFDTVFSSLGVNTLDGVKGALRLLNRAGVPFTMLAGERCCGRDLLLAGDREGFLALARRNIAEFTARGVKRIITNCAECAHTLKVEYQAEAGGPALEVLHMSEVIAAALEDGKLHPGKMNRQVTYHDPCTLGRQLRVFEAPRQALRAVSGLELREMEAHAETAMCCGGVPWIHCGAVNKQIQMERLRQAESTGASALVTACPKCQIHLKCAQKDSAAPKVEVVDLAELMAQATLNEQSPSLDGRE